MGTAMAVRPASALTRDNGRMVKLFAQTVGKELRGAEIDEALVWCEVYGANPFVKDIYFFVYDANDAETRRVVPVLSIGMYRKIAARTGCYLPDDTPARVTYNDSIRSPANPAGIVSCEVGVYQHAHGEWHYIVEKLKWEERAPIVEGGFRWEDIPGQYWPNGDAKRRKVEDPTIAASLNPNKKSWRTMPETMLAKCVEAAVIRKAWPEQTSGSYVVEEMDVVKSLDLTATEIIAKQEAGDRLERIGMAGSILVQWEDGTPLEPVPVGKLGDRSLEFIKANAAEQPGTVMAWWDRNVHAFREFWGRDKDGCLAVKQEIERVRASLAEPAA